MLGGPEAVDDFSFGSAAQVMVVSHEVIPLPEDSEWKRSRDAIVREHSQSSRLSKARIASASMSSSLKSTPPSSSSIRRRSSTASAVCPVP